MKGTMQKVDMSTMRSRLSLPHDIVGIGFIFIVSETVILPQVESDPISLDTELA